MSSEVINAGGGIMVEVPTATTPAEVVAEKRKTAPKPLKRADKVAAKTDPNKAAKKAVSAKGKDKAPAAKAADKTKAGNGVGPTQMKVLALLAKAGKGLTRVQIGEKTGINSGFTSLLGHVDPASREPQSLAAKGLIKSERHDVNGKDVYVWVITAKGKEIVAKPK